MARLRCPTCYGSKKRIIAYNYSGDYPLPNGVHQVPIRWGRCGYCHGTGYIEKEEEVKKSPKKE